MKLSIKDIAHAIGGRCLNEATSEYITSISTDSRKIDAGSLFIPIKGENFDGHHYIDTVFEKGAIAVITENEEVTDQRLTTIYVKDTKQALLDVARYYRSLFEIPVVAVTGSVGKTTTKDMVSSVLSGKFNVHKTQGNFNNEIGLPLTLFNLNTSHEAAVIEMGMNHFGEIHNLSVTAMPHIGIITNIGTSHIENLGSREGILKAKLEILDGLDQEGLLIVNGDDEFLSQLKDLNHKVITCGKQPTNMYYATEIVGEGMTISARIHTPNESYKVCIDSPGEHMVYNTLVAIAAGEALGLTKEEILKGIASYTPGKMRMNIKKYENHITIIDDTYNASPDSMKAALNVLAGFEVKGKKIAVLGDMFEMGDFAPSLHNEVGEYAGQVGIDALYAVGELAEHIYKGTITQDAKMTIKYYKDKESFINEASLMIHTDDVVLVKASRGMQFEKIVEAIRKVNLQ